MKVRFDRRNTSDRVEEPPPGLHPRRLVALMRAAIERCRLDLSGQVVLTEAASGAYVVTPVLAAMAGAEQVYAVTHSTRYGAAKEVIFHTSQLARLAGVQDRLEIVTEKSQELVSRADIITNSGHVRPIDATMIAWMKPTAVIPLMYEAWEFRREDVDLESCRARGIAVAGTNETHPSVDVFSFLGVMAVKLLLDAGISVYGCRILLLCDNPFARFIERGLTGAGAIVDAFPFFRANANGNRYDAILVAVNPGQKSVFSEEDAAQVACHWPGAIVVQFWGDVGRANLSAAGVPVWPLNPPAPGHMGVLPSAIGPEPVVRLQTGGLKVGEMLARSRLEGKSFRSAEQAVEECGWGQRMTG